MIEWLGRLREGSVVPTFQAGSCGHNLILFHGISATSMTLKPKLTENFPLWGLANDYGRGWNGGGYHSHGYFRSWQ
jgi:hypothetical protein